MDTAKICEHCGKPIGPRAVGGICPECLMKVGLGSGARAGGAPPPPRKSVALSIEEIAKRFPQLEILELLGEGGMGAVYKARQRQLDRLVALKILPADAAKDPGFAERFVREARALAKLSHPNIVALYEFGQADGFHYFIMEFVDGVNLRQLEQAGKLSARQALQVVPQICEALQFAHDEGIIHRDIKPENVLLDKKGRVKIADFGLAKILGREPEVLRLTGARDFMGTPHYMAPEQVEHPQTVDHRADIYSLGVVFYEMLTGELPLGRFQPPSKKVEVDVRLDEVVLHTLEKEPERRYQHAKEVKTDIEGIAGSAPLTKAETKSVPSAWHPGIIREPALFIFALFYGAFLVYLFSSALSLPERVATQFGGTDWHPVSWMSRPFYLCFLSMLPILFVAIFTAVRVLPIPAVLFNIPNRGYWLGPERRASTVSFIFRQGLCLGCVIIVFVAELHFLVIQANMAASPRLPSIPFIIAAAGFLLSVLLFTGHFIHHFGDISPQERTTWDKIRLAAHWPLIGLICVITAIAVRVTAREYLPQKSDASFSGIHPLGSLGSTRESAGGGGMGRRAGENGIVKSTDQVLVEDTAMRVLAAIRDKDDLALKELGTDEPIKGWRDALPQFAFELRERFHNLSGKSFDMQPAESLVEDNYAAVKCTGPKELEGKYLALFFAKTADGWRDCSMRNSLPAISLKEHLDKFKAQIQKSNSTQR